MLGDAAAEGADNPVGRHGESLVLSREEVLKGSNELDLGPVWEGVMVLSFGPQEDFSQGGVSCSY
jgi:hypothetical protein